MHLSQFDGLNYREIMAIIHLFQFDGPNYREIKVIMHLFQFNGLNYREIKVKMHLFHLDGLGSAEHRVIAEPSHFQLYREIIPSFHLHSKMGLSGQRLRQIRGELKLYWSQVTDLDTCCKHLEQLLSEQPILNT